MADTEAAAAAAAAVSHAVAVVATRIVVERLTKNVNEDHLFEIFGQYGEIDDLDLPVNRQSGINRGTAYILYMNEADAHDAIAHMHEAQLDGAVINVSIAWTSWGLGRRPFRRSRLEIAGSGGRPQPLRSSLRHLPPKVVVTLSITIALAAS
ncbi:RNA-binding protein with serine-rich domain 1-A [Madurella mycetomatis]|uniref:RNA-binding protein with serine-rich domain 1-A n=1 Tax=Madurella mycetomatis TaxID=100816 RepID=A0A175WFA4_9PEZI|nr:RNA-binding protein with serine-rich domain 1-A [Madurella mycetomatis]